MIRTRKTRGNASFRWERLKPTKTITVLLEVAFDDSMRAAKERDCNESGAAVQTPQKVIAVNTC